MRSIFLVFALFLALNVSAQNQLPKAASSDSIANEVSAFLLSTQFTDQLSLMKKQAASEGYELKVQGFSVTRIPGGIDKIYAYVRFSRRRIGAFSWLPYGSLVGAVQESQTGSFSIKGAYFAPNPEEPSGREAAIDNGCLE